MKVIINDCFGGFGLSFKAIKRYAELKGFDIYAYDRDYDLKTWRLLNSEEEINECLNVHYMTKKIDINKENDNHYFSDHDIERSDPILVKVIEELGKKASDKFANLKVIEIPNDVKWEIDEYDGNEHIAEKHRTWS